MDTYYAENLFTLLKQNIPDGVYMYHCTTNNIEINFQIINYTTDTILNSTAVTYGNTTADTQMLILKFHGNLTINSGITVKPQVRKKGMLIYVAGTLINNGTISMTQRGASAVGQDVYLYKNEYVPAKGENGGTKVGGSLTKLSGNNGTNGTNRKTGGGGSGGFYSGTDESSFSSTLKAKFYSGAGGAGTSYSGGTGGGGLSAFWNTGDANKASAATAGSSTGGAGGNAVCRRTSANNWNATGGIGNPSGTSARKTSVGIGTAQTTSASGTGGLLIIFANDVINAGTIESKGTASVLSGYNNTTHCCPGGASGGGSINVFAKTITNTGTIAATGGTGVTGMLKSGNGGNGSVTLTLFKTSELIKQNVYDTIINKFSNKPVITWSLNDEESNIPDSTKSVIATMSLDETETTSTSTKELVKTAITQALQDKGLI